MTAIDDLLELAPDPMLVLDHGRAVEAANEPAGELLGYERAELIGLPVERLLELPDPAPTHGLHELRAYRRDGAELRVEASLTASDSAQGAVLSLRDVSARHRDDARLREAGQRFQRVFEEGPIGMGLVDDDFRLLEVNEAFCRLTGYDADELRGRSFTDITHPDDVDTDLHLARKLFAGEVPGYSIDKRYLRADGEVVWVELTASVIRDEHGRPLKGMGLVQDITERRRALADAQTELARLARDRDRILEFAGEGIYHVDPRGRITFANPAAARMLGWKPQELVGKPAHELLHHTRADGSPYPRAECPIHGPGGAERVVENLTDDLFWRRDGAGFPVHYRSAPVPAADSGVVVVFSDVSERVRMEQALEEARERAARERLQAAEDERARWARELHDETLQGLAALHVLLSSAGWAGDLDAMREHIARAQDEIESEMDKLRGLITELRPAALDELGLEASVRDLAERTRAVYGLEVETLLELHAPDGSPRRLRAEVETAAYRIVQECLGNAARHARASHVVIELAPRNGALDVSVSDDGRGFDPADQNSGFGLRGMRERVDLLAGRIEIDSGAGRGTRVVASLPLDPPPSLGGQLGRLD
jgi:PAS domain S-box-containing protein